MDVLLAAAMAAFTSVILCAQCPHALTPEGRLVYGLLPDSEQYRCARAVNVSVCASARTARVEKRIFVHQRAFGQSHP